MRIYLECCMRKGNPRIAIEVCKTCRFNKKCSVFRAYRNPSLFEDKYKHLRNSAT